MVEKILKIESMGFSDTLNVGYERKRRHRGLQGFGLSNWKDAFAP